MAITAAMVKELREMGHFTITGYRQKDRNGKRQPDLLPLPAFLFSPNPFSLPPTIRFQYPFPGLTGNPGSVCCGPDF